MTILEIPVASAMAWLLAFAFAGAGLFNAIGGAAGRAGGAYTLGLSGVVELRYRPSASIRCYFQSSSGVPNALFQAVRKRGNQE